MNNAIKNDSLPPMIAHVLHDPLTHVDNLFADTWRQLHFGSLIHKAGFGKRSGGSIRIISARKATKQEKKYYEQNN